MSKLYLDIETLPPSGGGHLERILATIKPPGNIKLQASIDKWMAENAADVAAEKLATLGLDGLYGEVAVIGFAVDDSPPYVAYQAEGVDEAAMICVAFKAIEEAATSDKSGHAHPLTVVGHNVLDFDLRFLFQRAVRHGIKIPACLKGAFDPDKARYNVIDTMKLWGGWKGYVKLKDLTRELCGDTSDDIDGSQVAATWFVNPQEVVNHCWLDVNRTRSLYQKVAAVL